MSLSLTRDETLTLVFDKLRVIEGEVEECENHSEWVRSEKESGLLRELHDRVTHIGTEARRAIQLIEHYEQVNGPLPRPSRDPA